MKFMQRLGKSMMLPVSVLPIAAILMGISYWIATAVGGDNIAGVFLGAAGGALLDNMPILFAVGISIGMASKSDGTSALAGLVSWLTITTLLAPGAVAGYLGIEVDAVNPAFGKVQNVFVGIIAGLIGAWCYDRFKGTKLPDALSFFSGRRSVSIMAAAISIVVAIVLFFVWPFVYGALVTFGEAIVGLGPLGAGIYGFFNRLLIPLGLHHALNSVFWFDVAGINDLNNFLSGTGVLGETGVFMAGFFPIMMFGLPGAALAMYVTAKPSRKQAAYGILLAASVSAFFVGVTEPLEFSFMFVAPALYVIHALFTGISLAITAMLPVRMGFGFSAGFIDMVLNWTNPMALNPWALPLMGLGWFAIYFLVFRFAITRWNMKTPGREDDDVEEFTSGGASAPNTDEGYLMTGHRFIQALGGKENISELDNCATRLRMEIVDPSQVNEAALRQAGAAGVIKAGAHSVQVIYGLNVQFVKDAMETIIDSNLEVPDNLAQTQAAAADGRLVDGDLMVAAPAAVTLKLRQPVPGTVVALDTVPDKTFAEGMLGAGVAIEPSVGTVVAPADGTVAMVFKTGHAVALVLDGGEELLIHVGLDTVEMKGEGFQILTQKGARVTAGTPLLKFDIAKIKAAGHPTVTPVVVTNDKNAVIEFI